MIDRRLALLRIAGGVNVAVHRPMVKGVRDYLRLLKVPGPS